MQYRSIRQLFDTIFAEAGTVVDVKLYKKIKQYRVKWSVKNTDVIEFLNSGLLGNKPIRFTSSDESDFFSDVLRVEPYGVSKKIGSLKGMNPNWNVATNEINQVLIYLIYKFFNHPTMTKDEKEDAIKECYYIFGYRSVGSRLYRYFKYSLDEQTAITVSEKLSNKFMIKQLGTWQKYFEYRANDVLPKGVHAKRLKKYDTVAAKEIANDMWRRITKTIIYIYSVIDEVVKSKTTIAASSVVGIDENGSTVEDITSRPDRYVDGIKNVVYKPNDFINPGILHLVKDMTKSLGNDDLDKTLLYMSDTYVENKDKVDFILEKTVIISIEYLSRRHGGQTYNSNLIQIIRDIRNYYSANKVKNDDIEKIKKYIGQFYIAATNKRSKTYVANIRIAVILYVFVAALKFK